MRTPIAQAKQLGSAKEGGHHWWLQRVTAIALVPLVIWFVVSLLSAVTSESSFFDLLKNPIHALLLLLFINTALYHGSLGMRVVIEDYVHCNCGKPIILLLIQYTGIALGVLTSLAVITTHIQLIIA